MVTEILHETGAVCVCVMPGLTDNLMNGFKVPYRQHETWRSYM